MNINFYSLKKISDMSQENLYVCIEALRDHTFNRPQPKLWQGWFVTLSPKIHMQILQINLHTFP